MKIMAMAEVTVSSETAGRQKALDHRQSSAHVYSIDARLEL
jgi:hypothetical protein